MIFDSPFSPLGVGDLTDGDGRWQRRRAEALLRRFEMKFPGIRYDLVWSSGTVNAQAIVDRMGPRVLLYGGLARHRQVSLPGLAFAVAHETGHHLGGPPHHPIYPWLSDDGRADQWALEAGVVEVFGHGRGVPLAVRGLGEILALQAGDDAQRRRREALLKGWRLAGGYSTDDCRSRC